jgi:hypothetical protein
VARNPLLFDAYGDLIEEESSDEEGDKPEGEYIEENPYADINLEGKDKIQLYLWFE